MQYLMVLPRREIRELPSAPSTGYTRGEQAWTGAHAHGQESFSAPTHCFLERVETRGVFHEPIGPFVRLASNLRASHQIPLESLHVGRTSHAQMPLGVTLRHGQPRRMRERPLRHGSGRSASGHGGVRGERKGRERDGWMIKNRSVGHLNF